MKKIQLLSFALIVAAFTGCTMTHQDKNLMKEPNGNIRVETATIKRFVPVSYTYETNVTTCSEVAFLTYVTKQDPSINNIYEIHWNQIENHKNILGFKTKKKYTCEFWGVGIEYGGPLPQSSSAMVAVMAAPAAGTAAPQTAAPAEVSAAAPAVGSAAPAVGSAAPTVGTAAPAVGTAASAVGTAAPTSSASVETAPVKE